MDIITLIWIGQAVVVYLLLARQVSERGGDDNGSWIIPAIIFALLFPIGWLIYLANRGK